MYNINISIHYTCNVYTNLIVKNMLQVHLSSYFLYILFAIPFKIVDFNICLNCIYIFVNVQYIYIYSIYYSIYNIYIVKLYAPRRHDAGYTYVYILYIFIECRTCKMFFNKCETVI